jgi:hypothetical protein
MVKKWNLIPLGTDVTLKGDEDIDGKVVQYLTDNGEIQGYILETTGGYAIVALDDNLVTRG